MKTASFSYFHLTAKMLPRPLLANNLVFRSARRFCSKYVCVCLTPRLILFPEERFWLWRLAPLCSVLLWTVEETKPKGATTLSAGEGTPLTRSDSSLNEGSFFPPFLLSLFVFLPPPYKFARARLLSDATALDRHPSLFVFVGDGVEERSLLFSAWHPSARRIKGSGRWDGGDSNSFQSFFLRASQTDPRDAHSCVSSTSTLNFHNLLS